MTQPVMALYHGNPSRLMGGLDSTQALCRRMARVAERLDRPDRVQQDTPSQGQDHRRAPGRSCLTHTPAS